MMPSDRQKNAISQLFVGAIHALETGVLSPGEFNGIVDMVSARLPGDERQQNFYGAIRELAKKVVDVAPVRATPGQQQEEA